jgi:hypothetical protein
VACSHLRRFRIDFVQIEQVVHPVYPIFVWPHDHQTLRRLGPIRCAFRLFGCTGLCVGGLAGATRCLRPHRRMEGGEHHSDVYSFSDLMLVPPNAVVQVGAGTKADGSGGKDDGGSLRRQVLLVARAGQQPSGAWAIPRRAQV